LSSLSEILALDEFLHVPVRQLSLGQRVRADLAAAFLHRPDVIVLDEPTIGLDALAKANVRRFIRDVRDTHGVAVLLTTHDLGDIEQLCDRLLIIDRGKLLFDGSVADAIRAFAPQTSLVVDLTEEVPDPLVPPAGADDIVREGPTRLRIHFARTADTAARVTSEVLTRYQVRDLLLEEPRIEDVVRRLYAEKGHPAADQIEAADV
jgi:ABC-2 type transport system ATP-binding protein